MNNNYNIIFSSNNTANLKIIEELGHGAYGTSIKINKN